MKVYIFYRRELFYTALGYVVVFTGLDIVFIELVKSRALQIADTVILLLPILLLPFLRRIYSREVFVDLLPDRFDFKVIGRRGEINKRFLLSSLASYRIQYPTDGICAVQFKAVGQHSVEYSFNLRKREPSDGDVQAMVDQIHQMIDEYNGRQVGGRRIGVLPSFYASRAGLVAIVVLSVLLAVLVVVAYYYKNEAVEASFVPPLALILHIIWRRSVDLQTYRKLNGR